MMMLGVTLASVSWFLLSLYLLYELTYSTVLEIIL